MATRRCKRYQHTAKRLLPPIYWITPAERRCRDWATVLPPGQGLPRQRLESNPNRSDNHHDRSTRRPFNKQGDFPVCEVNQ
jgi:hypothetical protein